MLNSPDNKASTPSKANEHNNKLGQSSNSSKLVMTGSQFVDPNGAEKTDTGNQSGTQSRTALINPSADSNTRIGSNAALDIDQTYDRDSDRK